MYEFDKYINSIIRELKISKKMKCEMAEEFRDHLQMLKNEYLSKGTSEREAVMKAIESFGQEDNLKRMFFKNNLTFRNKTTLFTGIILIVLIYIIGCSIPAPGIDTTYLSTNYLANIDPMAYNTLPVLSIVLFVLSILAGYFIPIILPINKINLITAAALISGMIAGSRFYLSLTRLIGIEFTAGITYIAMSIILSLLGILIGYLSLIVINRMSLISVKNILKR